MADYVKVKLIFTFWHRGPNGNHLCLVLELAGPKIEDFIKYHPGRSFTLAEMQKVALDTTTALGYLHAEGYVHGGEQFHLKPLFAPDMSKEHQPASTNAFYNILSRTTSVVWHRFLPLPPNVSLSDMMSTYHLCPHLRLTRYPN